MTTTQNAPWEPRIGQRVRRVDAPRSVGTVIARNNAIPAGPDAEVYVRWDIGESWVNTTRLTDASA